MKMFKDIYIKKTTLHGAVIYERLTFEKHLKPVLKAGAALILACYMLYMAGGLLIYGLKVNGVL